MVYILGITKWENKHYGARTSGTIHKLLLQLERDRGRGSGDGSRGATVAEIRNA